MTAQIEAELGNASLPQSSLSAHPTSYRTAAVPHHSFESETLVIQHILRGLAALWLNAAPNKGTLYPGRRSRYWVPPVHCRGDSAMEERF